MVRRAQIYTEADINSLLSDVDDAIASQIEFASPPSTPRKRTAARISGGGAPSPYGREESREEIYEEPARRRRGASVWLQMKTRGEFRLD